MELRVNRLFGLLPCISESISAAARAILGGELRLLLLDAADFEREWNDFFLPGSPDKDLASLPPSSSFGVK